ncbi:MAG: aldehyde dehydrogenase [Trueperaceae bacterium]
MKAADVMRFGMFIDGEFTSPDTQKAMEIEFPFDRTPWAQVPEGRLEDVERAVAAARAAFDGGWGESAPSQRGDLMRKLAAAIRDNAERLAEMEARSNGKLLAEAKSQMKASAKWFEFYAGLSEIIFGHSIPLGKKDTLDYTVREPYGVIAAIVPWNSPLLLLSYKIAPALAAGNTVVVKPAEQTPVTTLELARLASEVGFPNGVINVVTGLGAVVGDALATSSGVDKVAFTGGTETGRHVARAAGENLKPVTLELGGKSPNIVFADANMDKALIGVVRGIFSAGGQTCRAGSRLLVERTISEQFLEKLVAIASKINMGNPLDSDVQMGPIVSEQQVRRIDELVKDAVTKGAKVLTGGERVVRDGKESLFYPPTILDNVDGSMRVLREEVFGPVLCVLRFDDEEECVQIANDTSFGLSAGVWTQDINRALRMVNRIVAGSVWVNTYREASHLVPFGGYKDSGHGRENGIEALWENTRIKNVWIDYSEETKDPFVLQV